MKKTVVQNNEVEVKDTTNPIEIMRHRDTDADGVCDYIDSNGYSKKHDMYLEISSEEYKKLKVSRFDVTNNCRRSSKNPDKYILRYSENQKTEIDTIIKPVLKHTVSK